MCTCSHAMFTVFTFVWVYSCTICPKRSTGSCRSTEWARAQTPPLPSLSSCAHRLSHPRSSILAPSKQTGPTQKQTQYAVTFSFLLYSYAVTSSFLYTNLLKADLIYTKAEIILCSCAVTCSFLLCQYAVTSSFLSTPIL